MRFGEWYYPNGSMVPNSGTGHDFFRGRGTDRTIRLSRRNDAQSPTGSFCLSFLLLFLVYGDVPRWLFKM